MMSDNLVPDTLNLEESAALKCRNRRSLLVGMVFILLCESAIHAEQQVLPPRNLLAGVAWEYSIDNGETFSETPPIVSPGNSATIVAKVSFAVKKLPVCTYLELSRLNFRETVYMRGVVTGGELNGAKLKGPLEGMWYRAIPAIEPSLLSPGQNTLTVRLKVINEKPRSRRGLDMTVRLQPAALLALTAKHLKFDIEPVLGAFGPGFFTITSRTNIPAKVAVYSIDLKKKKLKLLADSPKGLLHRIRVQVGPTDKPSRCLVVAENSEHREIAAIAVPPTGKTDRKYFRFIAMGDSRTNPADWTKVAAAVLEQRPELVVFYGDMVDEGLEDWEWVENFFGPGRYLFAAIPTYAVIGNHEARAPLYYEVFYTPPNGKDNEDGRSTSWSQRIGGVLLIGIDGEEDFSAGTKHYRWLEERLRNAGDAEFIFFFNHYPAYSSGKHGRLDENGRPRQKTAALAREHIIPLLNKYKVTAYICGHSHNYERSELPGGVTQIISGGAGAPPHRKMTTAAQQNPYSKIFASELHFCLFEIADGTARMKVLTPQGKVIDQREWKSRNVLNNKEKK